MKKELSTRVVLHEEVEVSAGFKASVEVDSVHVISHPDQIFTFVKLSHQTLVVRYCSFFHPLESHHDPCYRAPDQVH